MWSCEHQLRGIVEKKKRLFHRVGNSLVLSHSGYMWVVKGFWNVMQVITVKIPRIDPIDESLSKNVVNCAINSLI